MQAYKQRHRFIWYKLTRLQAFRANLVTRCARDISACNCKLQLLVDKLCNVKYNIISIYKILLTVLELLPIYL